MSPELSDLVGFFRALEDTEATTERRTALFNTAKVALARMVAEATASEQQRVCADCGAEFEITPSESNFFFTNHLNLPRRCKQCRDKRRAAYVVCIEEGCRNRFVPDSEQPNIRRCASCRERRREQQAAP